jgi:hypothetical protein
MRCPAGKLTPFRNPMSKEVCHAADKNPGRLFQLKRLFEGVGTPVVMLKTPIVCALC